MSYKLSVKSNGIVELEVSSIPSEAERKEIDNLIAPDGFIMAQVFKKLSTLGEYIKDITKSSPAQSQAPQGSNKATSSNYSKPSYTPSANKSPLSKCDQCGRNTIAVRTVKKEGANKGKTFRVCINEECGWKDLSGLQGGR